MLRFTFSNRFEILLDRLCAQLERARGDPFVAEQVIVPSAAIGRRIELALADRTGICANVQFSYLAQWLWRQIRRVVPEVLDDSPFAPEVLAWRVYGALGDAGFIAPHARLASYLRGADAVMRLDLARKVAELIEQYVTYRPGFLEAWSAGKPAPLALEGAAAEDEAWQAALWRRLAGEIGAAREHPSRAFFRRIDAMGGEALRAAGLPASAHVFCLPATPPLYLEILRKLAPITDLQVYVMNPCQEYWFEIVDAKRLTYLAAAGRAEHHESGNALLAAWGRQTQAHIDGLLGGDGEAEEIDFAFECSSGDSLLAHLQNSILALEELAPGSVALADTDRSIEVHVCHSLTRELEVLQDQLLALFAGPNPPKPDEILVVTPNLDEAAPLVDAVFGTVSGARRIPYAITGQPQRRVNPIARALDSLLALTRGRHRASEVFDFLMQEPVAARFAVADEDLESIRAWIEASAIRWGLDASERSDFDLPATADHAFADGLDRLYLGYAIGESGAPVGGRLGSGNAEGQRARALGIFWRFIEELRSLRRDWRRPKNAGQWREALGEALACFVAEAAAWAESYREVRAAIAGLTDRVQRAGLAAELPLEVVHSALCEMLDEAAHGGIPSGKVTFASIASLRNLPYRIVCAVGMNDGAFPRAGRALEFDLVALAPRRGDRQRRLDDRNLFLDLLLAARERLYLSYTGRSVRDNRRRPASVLLAELLDTAVRAASADAAAERAVRRRLVVEHPLQPFSPEYFATEGREPRLRSFNTEYCDALREQMLAPARIAAAAITAEEEEEEETAPDVGLAFFARPLATPGPEWRTARLEQLHQFFSYPSRSLLGTRLGIALAERAEELADDEPFLPERAARQALAERLLDPALRGASEEALRVLARAGNEYPAGPLGDAALTAEVRTLRAFAQGLCDDRAAPAARHAAALSFIVAGEEWLLEDAIELHAGRFVGARYDEVRASDYLCGWITHLFVCATRSAAEACTTRWHSRDGVYTLRRCAEARERLAELLTLYRQGLCEPLRFFPRSSWAYATRGLAAARNKWIQWNNPQRGESQYAAYRLALRGVPDPIDDAFAAVARQVLAPLLQHLADPRL